MEVKLVYRVVCGQGFMTSVQCVNAAVCPAVQVCRPYSHTHCLQVCTAGLTQLLTAQYTTHYTEWVDVYCHILRLHAACGGVSMMSIDWNYSAVQWHVAEQCPMLSCRHWAYTKHVAVTTQCTIAALAWSAVCSCH